MWNREEMKRKISLETNLQIQFRELSDKRSLTQCGRHISIVKGKN